MTVKRYSGDEEVQPYYHSWDPDMNDLDTMVNAIGDRDFFNFVVTGTPAKISPEWLAKHPGWAQGEYDYAVSYSIWKEDVYAMLEEGTPSEAFNAYLEGTGKTWLEIEEVKLVDRVDPWENTM